MVSTLDDADHWMYSVSVQSVSETREKSTALSRRCASCSGPPETSGSFYRHISSCIGIVAASVDRTAISIRRQTSSFSQSPIATLGYKSLYSEYDRAIV